MLVGRRRVVAVPSVVADTAAGIDRLRYPVRWKITTCNMDELFCLVWNQVLLHVCFNCDYL